MSVPVNLTEGKGATPLESLRQFSDYHYLMIKVFAVAIEANHGFDEAVAHIREGARQAGNYRGLAMHDSTTAIIGGRSVVHLLENWEGSEWDLPVMEGTARMHVADDAVTFEFDAAPGSEYLSPLLPADLAAAALDAYWSGLAEGITQEYASGVTMTVDPVAASPWRATFTGAVERVPNVGERLHDPNTLLIVNRRVTGLLGAIQMYITRSLVEQYDASGDETVRQAAYRFGADRGSVIRERILSQGKELTLTNFASKDGLQERDPSDAVFTFRDRQHMSDGAYYLDCTYCPLAEVWKSEGEEGLKLAYLFDSSNHRGLFQSYNPETEVRWTTVKSRGDTVCRFRFTVPGLMTEDDPTPEEFDAADPMLRR